VNYDDLVGEESYEVFALEEYEEAAYRMASQQLIWGACDVIITDEYVLVQRREPLYA
jgi:hypothetical protein